MKLRFAVHLPLYGLFIGHWIGFAKDVLEFPIELELKDERCNVEVSAINGDVDVVGYEGDVIRLRARGDFDEDRPKFLPKGWHVSQAGNSVDIHFGALSDLKDLSLKVPYKSNVKIEIIDGDIAMRELSGEFEISSKDGDLDMRDMQGSVIASTVDGDVELSLASSLPEEFFISLNTLDGDIELEMPTDIGAVLSASAFDGDVEVDDDFFDGAYTDSNRVIEKESNRVIQRESNRVVQKETRRVVQRETKTERSKGVAHPVPPMPPVPPVSHVHPIPHIHFGHSETSYQIEINGGGSFVQLRTVDGDIEVRARNSH